MQGDPNKLQVLMKLRVVLPPAGNKMPVSEIMGKGWIFPAFDCHLTFLKMRRINTVEMV